MTFGELLTHVYRVLEDPGQFAWPNSAVAFHVNAALRRLGQMLGDSGRLTLALTESEREYALPSGVRRIKQVRLIPEGGAEPSTVLLQVPIEHMPVSSPTEGDPTSFSLQPTGGTDENQFSMFVYPAPARSALAAAGFVIDYEIEYAIASDDPASTPQKAVEIPFPATFEKGILWYTIGGMLSERTDENDVKKGEFFIQKAEQEFAAASPINTTQMFIDTNRAFP